MATSYKTYDLDPEIYDFSYTLKEIEKLQENENIMGFDEVYKGKFFRKGLSKQWENILSEDQNIKIKKEFYITLKKFNYI